jgi:hypothetical protein
MTATKSQFQPSFAFWMVLTMVFFVFGGFGMHSLIPALKGNFPPAPPIVHLHGLLSVSWMLLLLAQVSLIGAGNTRLHRSLGTWGIAHATVLLTVGLLVQLIGSRRGMDAGRGAGSDGLYLGLLAFTGFALMFPMAIRNATRNPAVHRSMILLAMLPVLPPGVNRFWSELLRLDDPIPTFWLYLTLWSMAAAVLWYEKRTTGRISGPALFGAAWIFVQGALHESIVGSAAFNAVAQALLSLVHYR